MSAPERIADELLVLRCQEGDASAFEALVRRWEERLWRHAWRLTGTEDAAWDAYQEAWIAMARDIRRLEDVGAFPAWAYRITSNKCRDWIRREQRRRRTDETYAERMEHGDTDEQDTQQRCESVQVVLARLPGHDRAILSLRYEGDFAIAEIAEILQVPAGTVKSRLHNARKRLRQTLEDDGNE